MQDLHVSVDGPLLRVTINRPEKRNPLSRALLRALRDTFTRHAHDDMLALAVITGAADSSFAAGGDLKELMAVRTEADAEALFDVGYDALEAIRRFPVPVVAALNGVALGGGAELAVACDVRIAAAHAQIGFIQGTLNISTAWGGARDLMTLVGPGLGLALLAQSRILRADEAADIGLVQAVAAPGTEFAVFVQQFVAPLLRQQPRVMRAFKAQAAALRLGVPPLEARAADRCHFVSTWCHEDHWNAVDRVVSKGSGP
jgi:enoyl-CoA hydratase